MVVVTLSRNTPPGVCVGSYPQGLHVGLVAVDVQCVSAGLYVHTAVPADGHRLQTRTLGTQTRTTLQTTECKHSELVHSEFVPPITKGKIIHLKKKES